MKRIRTEELLSQREFAEILNRSESWCQQLEAGKFDPTYESIVRFIRRFRIDPRDLFEDEDLTFSPVKERRP